MDDDESIFDNDEKQRAWLEGCRREEAISVQPPFWRENSGEMNSIA